MSVTVFDAMSVKSLDENYINEWNFWKLYQ